MKLFRQIYMVIQTYPEHIKIIHATSMMYIW